MPLATWSSGLASLPVVEELEKGGLLGPFQLKSFCDAMKTMGKKDSNVSVWHLWEK